MPYGPKNFLRAEGTGQNRGETEKLLRAVWQVNPRESISSRPEHTGGCVGKAGLEKENR